MLSSAPVLSSSVLCYDFLPCSLSCLVSFYTTSESINEWRIGQQTQLYNNSATRNCSNAVHCNIILFLAASWCKMKVKKRWSTQKLKILYIWSNSLSDRWAKENIIIEKIRRPNKQILDQKILCVFTIKCSKSFLTLYALCINLQYVYRPTRCTKFLWLDFIFH